jgi:hypothetical protein
MNFSLCMEREKGEVGRGSGVMNYDVMIGMVDWKKAHTLYRITSPCTYLGYVGE